MVNIFRMFDFFSDFLYLWWRRAILIVWEGGWAGFPSPTCGPGGRRWGGRRRGGLGLPERLLWIVLEIILKLWTGVFTQRVVFVQILLLPTALWARGDNQRRHILVKLNEELDWNFKTEMMCMGLNDKHIPVATPQACCPLRPRSVSSYGQTAASSSSFFCPSSSLRLPGWYVPLVDGQRVYSSSCHSNTLVTWRQAYRVKLYLMRINDVILISADLNDVSTLLRLTEINPANFRILF